MVWLNLAKHTGTRLVLRHAVAVSHRNKQTKKQTTLNSPQNRRRFEHDLAAAAAAVQASSAAPSCGSARIDHVAFLVSRAWHFAFIRRIGVGVRYWLVG